MDNEFLRLLDSTEVGIEHGPLTALRTVPFLRHQFDWFIAEIRRKPVPAAGEMLGSYCGVKKLTPIRQARLDLMVRQLRV